MDNNMPTADTRSINRRAIGVALAATILLMLAWPMIGTKLQTAMNGESANLGTAGQTSGNAINVGNVDSKTSSAGPRFEEESLDAVADLHQGAGSIDDRTPVLESITSPKPNPPLAAQPLAGVPVPASAPIPARREITYARPENRRAANEELLGQQPAQYPGHTTYSLDAVDRMTVLDGVDRPAVLSNGSGLYFEPQSREAILAQNQINKLSNSSDQFDYRPRGGRERFRELSLQRDRYAAIHDNEFIVPRGAAAVSTLSIDVDTAAYTNVRQFILQSRQLPPPNAVRIEELINYFEYAYEAPAVDSKHPFAANIEIARCPWKSEHLLARVALKGRELASDRRPKSNLVFLVDVSGSMDDPNKLPLVVAGLRQLTHELNENDRVAIVVYAQCRGRGIAVNEWREQGDDPGGVGPPRCGRIHSRGRRYRIGIQHRPAKLRRGWSEPSDPLHGWRFQRRRQ